MTPKPEDGKSNKHGRMKELTKKKLNDFLASICDAKGMTNIGMTRKSLNKARAKRKDLICRNKACTSSKWYWHREIQGGCLCVTENEEKVTICKTVYDDFRKDLCAFQVTLVGKEIEWLYEMIEVILFTN